MKPSHFSHHFDGLKEAFKFMAQEIESLRKEKNEYRTKFESQAKELWDVRHSNVCDRCRREFKSGAHQNVGSPQSAITKNTSSLLPRSAFISKSFESLRNSDTSRIPIPSQRTTRRPIQHRTSIGNLESRIKSCVGLNTVAHSQPVSLSPPPLVPSISIVGPDSVCQERDWSITFNNKTKRINLEAVHALTHEQFISHLKFSHDGKFLAVPCYNGKAYIYDVQMGTISCVLTDPSTDDRKITAVSFSHDGKYLATASYESYIYVWEINTKRIRNAFKGKTPFVHSLDFSPNSRSLASVAPDNTIRLWKMRDGSAKVFTDNDPEFLRESDRSFTSAVFSPNGRYIAASHEDGAVRIWNEHPGQLIWRVSAHKDLVLCVAFMPDGKGLVSGGMDKLLKLWDISSLDFPRPHRQLQTMAATNSNSSRVEKQIQPEREFRGHEDSVYSLAVSRDGRWLASGSFDRNICVWDIRNTAMQYMLEGFWNAGNAAPCTLDGCWGSLSVDISPAGHYLASTNRDGLVTIWRYTEVRAM